MGRRTGKVKEGFVTKWLIIGNLFSDESNKYSSIPYSIPIMNEAWGISKKETYHH